MDETMTAGDDEFGEETSERVRSLREDLAEADRRLRELVEERPLTCLLAAVLGGYALARLVR